jgi:opacity protein-like surface antigen
MKLKNIIVKLFLINLFLFVNIYAQSKTGTTIGQFLKIEPSARIVGIGSAGASLSGDVSSAFYNPASLGKLNQVQIEFTYNKWLADITYNYFAAGLSVDNVGTFLLTGTMLNSGEMDVRTVEHPLGTGERFSVKNFAFGLGYGLMLTDRVSVGVQLNYISESIWHSSLSSFGMNFGVQYQTSENGLSLGASMSNFGPRAGYDGRDLFLDYDFDSHKYGDNDQLPAELRTDKFALPTIFRAGISYPFEIMNNTKLVIAVDAIHQNDNYQSVALGTELNLFDVITLRGGYRNLFLKDAEGGFVLGGGVKTSFANSYTVKFDYAYANYGILSSTHRITVGLGIK